MYILSEDRPSSSQGDFTQKSNQANKTPVQVSGS